MEEFTKGYTLMLNDNWDITVDGAGNIATANGAYAVAQNAANAVRLFTKDAYFNQTKGIPHFNIELGEKASVSQAALVNRIRKACLAVDGVVDCQPDLQYDDDGRCISGDIYLTLEGGNNVRIPL